MVIYEDNHLLVLNKPAGMLVQGDHTGDATLLDWGKAYLKEKYNKPGEVFLRAAHRLDRPTSGAVLCVRTSKAIARLNRLFLEKKVQKTYLALCLSPPAEPFATLTHFLVKNTERNTVTAHKTEGEGRKKSILTYEHDGQTAQGHHLFRVFPQTGRPHQIRVQLASIGCPIVGDLRYGAELPLPDKSIGLHCLEMTFEHPVKKVMMTVRAELPKGVWWNGTIHSSY